LKTEYLAKLEEIQKLIKKMDLPTYRKSVKHNDDVRWLKNNLASRNSKHTYFEKAMEIINQTV
jgi:hypothetical protein